MIDGVKQLSLFGGQTLLVLISLVLSSSERRQCVLILLEEFASFRLLPELFRSGVRS